MQILKNNLPLALTAFAVIAAIIGLLMPELAHAAVDDVWNAVNTEVAEPAVGMLTTAFLSAAVIGLLAYGGIGLLNGNFDIQKFMRILAIVIAVVICVWFIADFVGPKLTEGISNATSGGSSGLPKLPL